MFRCFLTWLIRPSVEHIVREGVREQGSLAESIAGATRRGILAEAELIERIAGTGPKGV